MTEQYAFPTTDLHRQENGVGMTLRDYFAAKALPSVLTAYYKHGEEEGFDYMWQVGIAKDAYLIADAMLKAREGAW